MDGSGSAVFQRTLPFKALTAERVAVNVEPEVRVKLNSGFFIGFTVTGGRNHDYLDG